MSRRSEPHLDRRSLLRLAGASSVATSGLAASSGSAVADESSEHYHNPIGPRGFGDVTVLRTCDGTFYVYGTHRPMARSDDLVNWEHLGNAVEWEPDWHGDPEAGFWAPDVNWYDDQVYLYYSYSTWGSQNNPGIGVATADSPEGPFTDQGPVFRAEDLGMTNAIDSELVVVDGTPYLIWGSWYGIHGVELTSDGRDYVPGTTWQLAGDRKEGAMVAREHGYYYLFYSTGHCCEGSDSTYAVEVGRSESLFGPYVNRDGDDLRDLNEHHSGQTVLSGTDRFVGPGHNTAIRDDDGNWWMLYHVEATAESEDRTMMLDRIRWDADDWPVVGDDGTPSARAAPPTVEADGHPERCESAAPCANAAGGSVEVDGRTVCDVDGDGRYRDLDGNGEVTHADVQSFFGVQHRPTWKQPSMFDFNGNDVVGHGDVVALFEHVATGSL